MSKDIHLTFFEWVNKHLQSLNSIKGYTFCLVVAIILFATPTVYSISTKDAEEQFQRLQSEIGNLNSKKEINFAERLFDEFYFEAKGLNSDHYLALLHIEKINFYKKIKAKTPLLKSQMAFVEEYCPTNFDEYCDACTRSLIDLIYAFRENDINGQKMELTKRFFSSPCKFERSGSFVSFSYLVAEEYAKHSKIDSAFQFFDQLALEMHEYDVHYRFFIHLYNTKGLFALRSKYYGIAINSFNKGLEVANNNNDPNEVIATKGMIPVIQGNIGMCYYEQGQLKQAIHYLELDSKGSYEYEQEGSHTNAEIQLAKIEEEAGQYLSAIKRLEALLLKTKTERKFIKWVKWTKSEAKILKSLSNLYQKIGKPIKALEKYNQYTLVSDSLHAKEKNNYKAINKAFLQSSLDFAKHELSSNTALWQEKYNSAKKDETISSSRSKNIFFASVLILFTGLFLFWRVTYGNRKKKELQKLELESYEQALELAKLKNQTLDVTNKRNKEKMNTLVAEIISKRNFSSNLIKRIDNLDSIKASDKTNLRQFVLTEMEVKSPGVEYLENLPENFIDNIRQHHPKLSDADLELCVLTILKFRNKQIAIKRNTTESTVKSSKNRLKKKLGITSDLYTYLKEIQRVDIKK